MPSLLRRTMRDHLRRSRPEKILNVFQRIRFRFFQACGLASGRTSFASSRRPMPGRLLTNVSLCFQATPSSGTDNAILSFQQIIPFFKRWHMAQEITAENQVIDILHRAHACDLEDVTRQCTNLTWNQVFLVVDHLSRTGQVMLVPAKEGSYTLNLLHRQGSRPDQYSLSSSSQGGCSCLI